MMKALQCLRALLTRDPRLKSFPIRIWGDSQLIIRHMLGLYRKPGKVRIYEAVEYARSFRKEFKNVAFRHTTRDLNKVPDEMARLSLE